MVILCFCPNEDEESRATEVHPLQANLQSSYITPPGAALLVGSDGEDLADSSLFLVNLDVLNCRICTHPLTIPVYQCDNGHTACASCWFKMGIYCSDCHVLKGSKRCRAMENVLESVISACCFVENGCMARVSYSDKLNHEKTCIFSPSCLCPHISCNYVGEFNEVYDHFSSHHSLCFNQFLFNTAIPLFLVRSKKHIFFQESNERTLFLFRTIVTDEIIVIVTCVAPVSSTRAFKVDLSATCCGRLVERKSVIVKNVPRMLSVPSQGESLRIPCNLCSIHDHYNYDMKLTIWRD